MTAWKERGNEMAHQPRYCQRCESYVGAKQWEGHSENCPATRFNAIDRLGLVWDDGWVMTDSMATMAEHFQELMDERRSCLMVQHIGDSIFEIAFIPGGGYEPSLTIDQQGAMVLEIKPGHPQRMGGFYCRQWGNTQ